MKEREEKIRAIASQLLGEGKVQVVAGYRKGTVAMRNQPFFARTPEEAGQLVWDGFCTGNLATYLRDLPKPAAVVAQGCVSRSIVVLINEQQLKREELVIIGVPCLGMIDRRKVAAKVGPGKVITEVVDTGGDTVEVKGWDFTEQLPRKELLRDNCFTCQHRNPVVYDELVADKVEDKAGGDIDRMAAPWEELEPEQRWQRFVETYASCIRCYACRDACPLCYCNVCFVDESNPQWCGKTVEEADVLTFQLLRSFHCAGRCTDCGACESACPQGIKVRALTSKIEKDIRQMFGHEAGVELGVAPPMATYRPDDPQDFIK